MPNPIRVTRAQAKRLERNLGKANEVKMKVVKKKPKTLIKELRQELRYWQMRARIESRNLKAIREKCKQIGAQMREIQRKDKSC